MRRINEARGRSFLWLLGLVVSGVACAPVDLPSEGESEEEELGESSQALAAPACRLSELSWTTGTGDVSSQLCAGPWEYKIDTSTTGPCADNGTCPNNNWNTCAHWDNGETAAAPVTKKFSYGLTGQCLHCEQWDIVGRREVCVGGWSECEFPDAQWEANQRACQARAETVKAEVLATVVNDFSPKYKSATASAGLELPRVTGIDSFTGVAHYAQFCNVTVSYTLPSTAKAAVCQCAEPLKDATCPVPGPIESRQSAPGLSREQLPEKALEARCSTCENLPLRSASDAQAMFDCLEREVTTGATHAIQEEAKRRTALLFEHFGTALRDASYTTARGYLTSFAPGLGCGVDRLTSSFQCLPEAQRTSIPASLALCHRLSASHVSTAVARREFDACMDAIGAFQDHAQACDAATTDEVRALLDRLTSQSLSAISWSTSDTAAIRDALGRIERWYALANRQEGADQDKLFARLSPVFASFWAALYADTVKDMGVAAAGNDQALVDALSAAGTKRTSAQLTVLATAFEGGALKSPALLMLTADALSPLLEAAMQRAQFVDVACRFKDCTRETPSQITALTHVLASLLTPDELNAALTTYQRALTPTMVTAFSKLAGNHALLRTAHATALGRDARLTELRGGDAPKLAQGLSAIVLRAQAARRNLLKTGFFRTPANLLHFGVNEEVRTRLRSRLDTGKQSVDRELAAYRDARKGVVQTLLQQLDRRQYADETERRAEQLYHRTEEMVADLQGLRQRDGAEAVRFGDVSSSVEALFDSPQLEGRFVFEAREAATEVSAADARYTGGALSQIDQIAVQKAGAVYRVEAKANERMHVDVANNWSPTCAIQKAMARSSNVLPFGEGASDAVTGPEGFWLESVGAMGRVHSTYANQERYTRKETSTRTCVGLSASGGFGFPPGAPIKASVDMTVSTERCESTARGTSSTKGSSDTSSTEQRMSARFNMGMRVEGTPFVDAPAGSLLLVSLPHGKTSLRDVTDVMVAVPGTVLTFREDSDVYLVVNDRADCGQADTKRLAVTLTQRRPVTALASQFAEAQATLQAELRAQLLGLLAQGSIGATELSQLRVRANRTFASALGNELARLPAELLNYVSDMVETELASLERKARQLTLMRELDGLRRDTLGLRADLLASQEKMRLGDLLLRWHLTDLAAPELEEVASEYARLTSEYAYPVLSLRHPRALAQVASHRSLNELLQTTLDTPFDTQVHALASFGQALHAALDTQIEAGDVPSKVTLAIPRPGTPEEALNEHRAIDAARAASFWAGVKQNQAGILPVEIRDVYEDRARPPSDVLACAATAPVIDSIGLYGVDYNNLETTRWNQRSMNVLSSPYLTFPQERGATAFEVEEQARDWLMTTVPLKYGYDESFASDPNVERVWTEGHFASGLSPFNTFRIETQNANHLDELDVLFLTFWLRTRQSVTGLTGWLETCWQYTGRPDGSGNLPPAPLPAIEPVPEAPIASPMPLPAAFTPPPSTPPAEAATPAPEVCFNGVDDDLDGATDCDDPQCILKPICRLQGEPPVFEPLPVIPRPRPIDVPFPRPLPGHDICQNPLVCTVLP